MKAEKAKGSKWLCWVTVFLLLTGHTMPTSLQRLRALMKDTAHVKEVLQAYIVPSGDAHQSEYVAACDMRRAFMTGFTGSAGTAIVTKDKAALWTDGRYFLQAEQELDYNWTLVKEGVPNAVTQAAWLTQTLPTGSAVGVDPFLISAEAWKPLEHQLATGSHRLVAVEENLVDLVWPDRPPPPLTPIVVQPEKYTGKPWPEKVKEVRDEMQKHHAGIAVISALDEVAWLLNLRGSDIMYNPVFFAYVVITMNAVLLFVDQRKITEEVLTQLQSAREQDPIYTVALHTYGHILKFLPQLMKTVEGKIWVPKKSSFALASLIPKQRACNSEVSPVELLKAIKNPTEIEGMRQAHIRDAAALCEFFALMEKDVPRNAMSEMSSAEKLLELRSQQVDFVGPSFETISSSGPSGSLAHYHPTAESDRRVTLDELYLCDSGGQYKDGTTDLTRTVHFGTPTDYEKECFTAVLKGHIALATTKFPPHTKGQMLDSFARTALWERGLNYLHGTGHGVGAYLNVHEGPSGISTRPRPYDPGLQAGMILSNEPGYYEDNKFGIRIENVVLVIKVPTKYNFLKEDFLGFETISFVPIQTKLVDVSIMTDKEIQWLNNYHRQCRELVGPVLLAQGRKLAHDWLMKETRPLG